MRKTLAIGLLFIHLLNLAGYTFIYACFIQQSETKMRHTIDAGLYDKGDVTILKTPLHLPYYNGSAEFEKVAGEVEIKGTHYTYIERKVSGDTLYLVCLLNKEKTALSKAKSDCIKETNALSTDNKKAPNSSAKKNPLGIEYSHTVLDYSFTAGFSLKRSTGYKPLSTLSSGALNVPYSPPDLV